MNWIAVFIGGGLGSVSRYFVGIHSAKYINNGFPLGTLIANFLACLFLGSAMYYFHDKEISTPWLKSFLLIGFCGGFSTFSTFSLETIQLFKTGLIGLGIINVLISLALCFSLILILTKNT